MGKLTNIQVRNSGMDHVESLYINMKFKVWNGPYWQVAMLSLEWSILASCRFLPGFLLPGPISYVERSDSFIVANSAYRPVEYWSILPVGMELNNSLEHCLSCRGTSRKPVLDHKYYVKRFNTQCRQQISGLGTFINNKNLLVRMVV